MKDASTKILEQASDQASSEEVVEASQSVLNGGANIIKSAAVSQKSGEVGRNVEQICARMVFFYNFFIITACGGAVASWLMIMVMLWTPDPAVRVRALAGVIILCSWARHLTLTVHLSTQVYK